MKLIRKRGATSNILQVFILDASSVTGAGLTGLTNASSGLIGYFHRDVDTTATAISLVSMTVGTFTSGGFKEIDATHMPGWYQFCPPDTALAATSTPKSVGMHLQGAANMVPLPLEIQLVAYDPEDTIRMGLTSLPNAAAEAAGGLYTRGTGAGQINQDVNGRVDANTKAWAGTSVTLTSSLPDVNTKTITNGIIAAATFASGALDAVWSTTARTLSTGAIVAGTFAANALDAVWSTTSRVLTAATNLAIPTAIENADALLKRDMSAVSGESARSPLNAFRFLRNKWGITTGTLTVTKEDDTTSAWTAAVTQTAGNPVSSVDPA